MTYLLLLLSLQLIGITYTLKTTPWIKCNKISYERISLYFSNNGDIERVTLQDDDLNAKKLIKSYDDILEEEKQQQQSSFNNNDSKKISKKDMKFKTRSSGTSRSNSNKVFGSLSIDDLIDTKDNKVLDSSNIKKLQDLNGIKPQTPFVFSLVPAVMCFISWRISEYLAGHFAIQFLDSDIYPVQRFAVISRNIVVGLFTLSSGFTGAISIGLILLGGAVLVGVLKGELDPEKESKDFPIVKEEKENPFRTKS